MHRASLLSLLLYVRLYSGTCEDLAKLKLPHTTIEHIETVAAGAATLPARLFQDAWAGLNQVPSAALPSFCRVALTIHPVPDSTISVEVHLPLTGWNERFVAVGNGGSAGQINWRAMSQPLSRGYAVASTDTGHQGRDSRDTTYADGHPEKVTDFAHRAAHEMAVAGKLVVKAFYGSAPKYSYWNGSSTGGRQGLKVAQMYPNDFDGIVSSAPPLSTGRYIAGAYRVPLAARSGAKVVSREKLKLLEAAAIRQCDRTDGIADGVIGDPTTCRFDLASVPELTEPERAMARAFYDAFHHPVTKREIYPGYPPGSERAWIQEGASLEQPPTMIQVRNMPGFDKPINFATDIERIEQADAGRIDASATDLSVFFKRGGKLLLIHGWMDGQVSPLSTVQYYRNVNKLGDAGASVRLFMVPGLAHSRGGLGVNDFDSLTVMETWVERGQAPERILGRRLVCALDPNVGVEEDAHNDAKTIYTRPLCPYPQVATYKGAGDPNDASSFACLNPRGPAAPKR